MRKLSIFLLLTVFLLAPPARAGMSDDCVQEDNFDLKLSACTRVIDSGQWKGADLAWAYNNRGLAREHRREYQLALADYNRAILLKSSYAIAYNNRGNVYAYTGEFERALADHNRAIAIDPEYVFAYNNRGADYEDLGQNMKALADYSQAIALDPDYANGYNSRANARCKLGFVEGSIKDRLEAIRRGRLTARGMQKRMQKHGFYKGAIDGAFGPISKAALLAWTVADCP